MSAPEWPVLWVITERVTYSNVQQEENSCGEVRLEGKVTRVSFRLIGKSSFLMEAFSKACSLGSGGRDRGVREPNALT